MTVEAIHLGELESPQLRAVDSVSAVAGKGLEGDGRYFYEDGAEPGRALTLVEAENVEAVGLPPGGTRRQLTTRGVRLDDLVGKRFRVGEVECYGVQPLVLGVPTTQRPSTKRAVTDDAPHEQTAVPGRFAGALDAPPALPAPASTTTIPAAAPKCFMVQTYNAPA